MPRKEQTPKKKTPKKKTKEKSTKESETPKMDEDEINRLMQNAFDQANAKFEERLTALREEFNQKHLDDFHRGLFLVSEHQLREAGLEVTQGGKYCPYIYCRDEETEEHKYKIKDCPYPCSPLSKSPQGLKVFHQRPASSFKQFRCFRSGAPVLRKDLKSQFLPKKVAPVEEDSSPFGGCHFALMHQLLNTRRVTTGGTSHKIRMGLIASGFSHWNCCLPGSRCWELRPSGRTSDGRSRPGGVERETY